MPNEFTTDAVSPDIMPCWSCANPVGGEWFDGSEVICDHCGEEGVATYFTDGSWACVEITDAE